VGIGCRQAGQPDVCLSQRDKGICLICEEGDGMVIRG
jgi:hypothetical protein